MSDTPASNIVIFIFFRILIMLIVAAKFVLPIISANIAKKKGYGFAGFYILGLFFFFTSLIISLCLSDKNSQLEQIKNSIHSNNNTTQSIADELQKYKTLLEQGAISNEEYEHFKKKIIEKTNV